MTKLYEVEMNSQGMPNYSTAKEVAERRNGKWEGTLLVKNSGRVKCSECYAIYDWDTQAQYFKYCPNCGADMRGV